MDLILLIARLGLAAVFAVAGIAKLLDLDGSRRAVAGFGVPERLAAPLGVLLPVAELAIAVALLPTVSARWGGLGALALTLGFIAAIGVNLAKGRTPDCHCFGQLHSEPAGWPTLGRNAALAAIAAFVLWQGWNDSQLTTAGWIADRSAGELAGMAVLLVMMPALAGAAWLTVGLLGRHGELLLRIEELESQVADGPAAGPEPAPAGLPAGTFAPTFSLPDLGGTAISLDSMRDAGKYVVLLFVSPACGVCTRMLPDVAAWQRDHADTMTIALVSDGSAEANRAKLGDLAIAPVLMQAKREVAEAYRVSATPSAVVVRADGHVASPVVAGPENIGNLVREVAERAVAQSAEQGAPAVSIGEPAPAFTLPSLAGEQVSLDAFRGAPVLTVFWRPSCGFCQRMLPDLRTWLERRSGADPDVVLISSESVEANRAMGLDVPILLDEEFATGRAFGARGTPSAVLIAADGTVQSPVTVGAPAIMQLLGSAAEVPAWVATA